MACRTHEAQRCRRQQALPYACTKIHCKVRDNIDLDILPELLSLGGLGIQYCIKSELAFSRLKEIEEAVIAVDYAEFNERYNQRDITARQKMRELVDSDANKVTKVFSTLFEE